MANLKRPGGELASRPLHFIWVVDCSGSMYGEKIGTVNHAIQSTIPEMADADRVRGVCGVYGFFLDHADPHVPAQRHESAQAEHPGCAAGRDRRFGSESAEADPSDR